MCKIRWMSVLYKYYEFLRRKVKIYSNGRLTLLKLRCLLPSKDRSYTCQMQAWVLRVLYKDKILLEFILIKNIGCGFSNNDKANTDSTGKLTKVRSDGAYFSLGEIR